MGILLKRKLFRTIKSTYRQFIALSAVVMIGVCLYISLNTAFLNISLSKSVFYEETGYADYYFHVISAPEGIVKQIAQVQGVGSVNGRIQKDVEIIKADNSRVTGRMTGYSLPMALNINRLYLLEGRIFDDSDSSGNGVLVNQSFSDANQFSLGDRIHIIADGTVVPLNLIGTAVSPEFQSIARNATSWFEGFNFGIIMIPEARAQQLLKMQGRVNQVLIKLMPGADEETARESIESILEPYGLITGYPQRDQMSYRNFKANLDSLESASGFMPAIFFIIVIFFLFILLKQIIKSQRLQIGVMKAMGFNSGSIVVFFTVYSVVVALFGSFFGILGGFYLSGYISKVFAGALNLPYVIAGSHIEVVLQAVLLCIATGILSGIMASRQITAINPAEAIRSEPPKIGHASSLEDIRFLWNLLSSTWRMTFRSISRNRVRFLITALGIGSSVMLLLVTIFYMDSKDFLLKHYFQDVNTYDYKVRFSAFIPSHDIHYWRNWNEIKSLEPVIEIPVTYSALKTPALGRKTDNGILLGIDGGSRLKKVVNMDLRPLAIPEDGIILCQKTAEKLSLEVGDLVGIETQMGTGKTFYSELKVMGITQQFVNPSSYASRASVSRLLDAYDIANAVFMQMDKGDEAAFMDKTKDIPKIEYILEKEKQKERAVQNMENHIFFTNIVITAAVILGFVIVYNTSIMCFTERQRELASLRVLGFANGGISALQFNELLLEFMLGAAIGLPCGRILGGYYIASIATEATTYPVVINPSTYILTAGITFGFVVVGHLLAMRRVKTLDLVEVLKNRD